MPLSIPYPDDQSVEFAIDKSDRLHILLLDGEDRDDGVSVLIAAEAWAERHLALINMAISPTGPLVPGQPTTLHLFTTSPRDVRPLLDANIHLHAIAPAPRDREWVSLRLN